jgi:TRAP-type mannitol/chloroaromatic compound transport system permease small subunit
MLNRFLRIIDRVNNSVGKADRWVIIFLTIVVLAEVVSRYVFNHTFIWTHETIKWTFGAYFILAAGYALLWGAHVKVDILHRRWPVKVRAIVDLATALFFFLFCGVLIWQGWLMFWQSLTAGAHTWSMWGPPYAPIHAMIPVGGFLLLMQGIAKFILDFRLALSAKERGK